MSYQSDARSLVSFLAPHARSSLFACANVSRAPLFLIFASAYLLAIEWLIVPPTPRFIHPLFPKGKKASDKPKSHSESPPPLVSPCYLHWSSPDGAVCVGRSGCVPRIADSCIHLPLTAQIGVPIIQVNVHHLHTPDTAALRDHWLIARAFCPENHLNALEKRRRSDG